MERAQRPSYTTATSMIVSSVGILLTSWVAIASGAKGAKDKDKTANLIEFVPVKLPPAPYDQSSFFVDYGLILETYPAVANTSLKADSLKSFIHKITVPISDYTASTTRDSVSDEMRKESVLSLIEFLAKNDTFQLDDVSNEVWKNSKIQGSIIQRESLTDLVKSRNSIFLGITSPQARKQAIHRYQQGMQEYKNVLENLSEDDFTLLVGNHAIEWNLYESRYLELLQLVKRDPAKFAPLVRKYFATWLRDGDQNDEMYRQLKEQAMMGRMLQAGSGVSSSSPLASASLWLSVGAVLAHVLLIA